MDNDTIIKRWSIKARGQREEETTLKHGFEINIQPEFIPVIEDYLDNMPKELRANFPSSLKDTVPKDWYINGRIYPHRHTLYFKEGNNALMSEGEMRDVIKTLSSGHNIGEGIYVKLLKGDKKIPNRLEPRGTVVSTFGKRIFVCTAEARSEFIAVEPTWEEYLVLHKISIKVNIGKKGSPADAVWWVDYRQGNLTDNIVCSVDGKWQLQIERGKQVINDLSLQEVIRRVA